MFDEVPSNTTKSRVFGPLIVSGSDTDKILAPSSDARSP